MQPLDRSSSALDFTRNSVNPPLAQQPLYSADHAQDSFDRSNAPYTPYRHSTESSQSSISTYGDQIPSNHSPPALPSSEEPSYWGSNNSAYDQPAENNTPKANTFESGQQWGSSSYGIDTSGGGQNSYTSDATETLTEETNGGGWGSREQEDGGEEEDEDDLGLGNSKGKKTKPKPRGSGDGEGTKDPEETPKGKEKEKEKKEEEKKGSFFPFILSKDLNP